MRILLSFLISLSSCFFLADLFYRLKSPIHSIIGLFLIIFGFITGFLGKFYISPPLDILLAFFLIGAGLGITAHHLLTQRYVISEKIETDFVRRHETLIERILEILPGALTWIALTSPLWLSLPLPFAVAYLIIIADVYWLINSLKIALFIYLGFRKMEWAKKQLWLKRLKTDFPNDWDRFSHLVLLPTYKESLEILKPSIEAVINSDYPKEKIYLVVGFEGRDDPQKIKAVCAYLETIKHQVGGVFTTTHPFGLEGEVAGQGSNKNWMIAHTLDQLKKLGLRQEDIFVTTLDADFVIHPEFLAGALHKYLTTPQNQRDKRSYTGVFLYYNNYWQAPAPTRLIAVGTSFWQLAEMYGSDKYQNYSSMSMNLEALLNVGLWIPNKVNDDSGFYWKAYFHFKGDYKVVPHYLPINADTVLDVSLFKTFQNQYLQLKRWAYGVEHIPFIFKQYFAQKEIDFWDKTDKLLFVLWANLKWGTLALFVTFAGLFIPLINPTYQQSVLAINLPIISSWILTAAFLGLCTTVYVHEKTVPPRPKKWGLITKAFSYIQWLLVPVVLVTLSTLPAIDAQTRLMFGKYLEFRVTNKARLTS